MFNKMAEIKMDLLNYKLKYGLLERIDCTNEETEEFAKLDQSNQPLPEDVYKDEAGYYRINELGKDETSEYLKLKQLDSITTIKNCLIFFVVLTVICLTIMFVMLIVPHR